jgi:predicted ferric reductase
MSSQPFFVNELFWGVIGLIGLGIAIVIELRKTRNVFTNILEFLTNSALSTVDEKIAVLYQYTQGIPNWQRNGIDTGLMISTIVSDINSVARLRNRMTWEQWREFHRVLILLTDTMRRAGINTIDIDAAREALH